MAKPYLFTFWEPVKGTPPYIQIALDLFERHLSDSFQHIHLNLQSAHEWSDQIDRFIAASEPFGLGRSTSLEGRKIAIFSDMLRIELLAKHGGLWIDADTLVMPDARKIADIVENYDFFCSESEQITLANGIIGGKAGSPFIGEMYNSMLSRIDDSTATKKLHWGELGFRLIEKVYLSRIQDQVCIAPFGTFIQNIGGSSDGIFSKNYDFQSIVAPRALALSMSNSSTSESIRDKSKEELLSEHTIFSTFYHRSIDDERTESELHNDSLFYNMSDYLRAPLKTRRAHFDKLVNLKQKLNQRSEKCKKAIHQRNNIAAKLESARKRIESLQQNSEE